MGVMRVVKDGTSELPWQPIPTPEGDPNPPGEETIEYRSPDTMFAFGLWRRVPETGRMDLSQWHEIMVIIEGEVEITEDDGTVHRIGPGDALICPRDAKATWKALSPVKKFWAVYKGE